MTFATRAGATCAAISLFAVNALAADLPARKYAPAPLLAAATTWTGFYVGLNAGGAFGNQTYATTGLPMWSNPIGAAAGAPATANALALAGWSNATGSGGGFLGGGQAGFNLQFANTWLAGLETDIQALAGGRGTTSALTTSSFAPFGFPNNSYIGRATFASRIDYLGTLRARFGYLVTPDLLVYATGGLAYGGGQTSSTFAIMQTFPGATFDVVPPIFGAASASARVGWTLGGGLEWMFASNWSAKFEYLYYDLGSAVSQMLLTQNVNNNGVVATLTPWGSAIVQTRTRLNGHVLRAGVNYHFDWARPGAVVAKY